MEQVGQDQGPWSPLADQARVDRSDREASRHGRCGHARTSGVIASGGRLHQPGAADAEHRSRARPLEEPDDVEEELAVGCKDEPVRCGSCADRCRQHDPAASKSVGGATRDRQRQGGSALREISGVGERRLSSNSPCVARVAPRASGEAPSRPASVISCTVRPLARRPLDCLTERPPRTRCAECGYGRLPRSPNRCSAASTSSGREPSAGSSPSLAGDGLAPAIGHGDMLSWTASALGRNTVYSRIAHRGRNHDQSDSPRPRPY